MKDSLIPRSESGWSALVQKRRGPLALFLRWAASREEEGRSLLLQNRDDFHRVEGILPLFEELWWGIVVYTCFDSVIGAQVAATNGFQQPIEGGQAERVLSGLEFPRRSVQNHRTQPAVKGAKTALISACSRSDDFSWILHEMDGFDSRYQEFHKLRAPQWGRTTCFDLLIRSGHYAVGGQRYAPERAYLAGSTGPSKGFELVWGIGVTKQNSEECEAILRGWTNRWDPITQALGVTWEGPPYQPRDFENALCIFQEVHRSGAQNASH